MQQKLSGDQRTSFKYKGQTYQVMEKIRIHGKLYLVVEKKVTRYKVFDVATQSWRSIRLRKGGVKYEMNLMQFGKIRNSSLPYTFDYFKDDKSGNEYLVQEWIEGYNLRHYLRRKQAGHPYFSAERSYYLIRGLVNGLNRLHERGVFHGDIKPENLIVGDAQRLVMIDFGAAWSGAQTRLRPDEKTRGYASPEQWAREKLVDHRTDQFATSVVLYEMLTNELPYDGYGSFGVASDNHPKLVPPSKKNREVWRSLDEVVMKGLSLNKDDRYETSSDWLKELNAATPPRHAKPSVFLHYLSN
jgi:serine/threonine protein kinase